MIVTSTTTVSGSATSSGTTNTVWGIAKKGPRQTLQSLQSKPKGMNLKKVYEILERVYPSRWDMTDKAIIIYYPEEVITNTKNEEHVLYDLYVKIMIKHGFPSGTLMGIRTMLSKAEFISGYSHSHLPSGDPGSFKVFCTGSSSLVNNLTSLAADEMKSNNSYELFEGCLYELEQFIRWESKEGTPHIHMNTISEKNRFSSGNFYIDSDTFHQIFETLAAGMCSGELVFNFRLAVTRGELYLIEDEAYEEILSRLASHHQWKDESGRYLDMTGDSNIPISADVNGKAEIPGFQEFIFCGEVVKGYIIGVKNEENDKRKKYAHRRIREGVTRIINRVAKSAWYRREIEKQEKLYSSRLLQEREVRTNPGRFLKNLVLVSEDW